MEKESESHKVRELHKASRVDVETLSFRVLEELEGPTIPFPWTNKFDLPGANIEVSWIWSCFGFVFMF